MLAAAFQRVSLCEIAAEMIRRFISIIKIKFKQNYQFNIFIKNFSIAKNKFPI